MTESQALFEICEKRPSHWGPSAAEIDLQNTTLFTGKVLFLESYIKPHSLKI